MNFKIAAGLATAAVMASSPLVIAPSAVASVPMPSTVNVSTIQPKAKIIKLKINKKGRPGVKVKANVPVKVLIAKPNSDETPVSQKKGTKTYRLPKVPKGNSARWAVIVYYKGEILAQASDKPFTWRYWIKMGKKCDRREPLVIVGSTRAKTVHVKAKGEKPTKLIDVARENGETAFGGKTLSGKKATYMVTMSPGRPKVYCK